MKKMITRRQFMAAAGVVAAASALTACGGSSASTAASSAAGSAAASGSTIKVGVLGPMTGDASVYGQAVVNGASLYMKQVNADGGVNGKQLEIIAMDEQGDATQAVTCFTKMCDQGITALVGDVTTTPTLAVAAESADYNMPMVTASATAEAVTYDAETDTVNANVFRATFTDPFQGIKMADYAYKKLGYTKAAVIFQKGADYNEGLAENFVTEFESLGGTIVDQESYSEGDVDYKTQLTTILGKAPEVVICPNYNQEVGQILAQAESIGLAVPFLGGDGWDGLEGYATADQLKDAYFCANYAKGSNPDFENAYKAEYGEEYPNGFAPLGYDAAMTVVYGIKAAEEQGLEAGSDEYKQAVIDAIAGGTIGSLFVRMQKGVSRGIFSNEAGLGTGSIAHACADTKKPVKQGMFGIFEVFADTIVICTITSLAVLASGVWTQEGLSSGQLALAAFQSVFGNFGAIFVAVTVFLFVFSTIISAGFFGQIQAEILFGRKFSKVWVYIYPLFICSA